MSISGISTSYLYSALLPAVQQAQSQLAQLEVESSTGQYADLGLQLGGQNGYELSLRTQDDLLQAMTTANGLTSAKLSISQTALGSILTSAQKAAAGVATWTSGLNSSATLQSLGQSQLQQLISLANTNSSGDYVFGGQNSGVAPLDDFYAQPNSSAKTSLDNAFQSYFGFSTTSPQVANITSDQMQAFLTGPVADQFQGANWGTDWSNASDQNTSAQIAPGNQIDTSTNANAAGFRQLAQGYAMLSEFGNIGLNASAEQALANTALGSINQGVNTVINTQATLGSIQNQVSQADDHMASQMTLLQTQVGSLDSVDPAKIATQLTQLTTQLQSAYQLTAQIHNLNLAQYLP